MPPVRRDIPRHGEGYREARHEADIHAVVLPVGFERRCAPAPVPEDSDPEGARFVFDLHSFVSGWVMCSGMHYEHDRHAQFACDSDFCLYADRFLPTVLHEHGEHGTGAEHGTVEGLPEVPIFGQVGGESDWMGMADG